MVGQIQLETMNASRDAADERMNQVRDLLLGDAFREIQTRIVFLENRVSDLENGLSRQLDAVEARIEALAASSDGDRRTAFEALAHSIADLGEQIKRISRG